MTSGVYKRTKSAWNKLPREIRICNAPSCDITFECKVNSKRKYCCRGHSRKGKKNSKEHIEAIINAHIGWHHTEESKEKNRKSHLGKHHSKRTIAKIRKSRGNIGNAYMSMTYSVKCNKNRKNSESHKRLWQNTEYREKQLKAIFAGLKLKPTKPERRLRKGLNKLFPNEYKYVGDGTTFIGGKNPDFININGQKKIIELFGTFWHSKEYTGRTKRQEENWRIKHFAKYGFKTLIVWQYELENIPRLRRKLLDFCKGNAK